MEVRFMNDSEFNPADKVESPQGENGPAKPPLSETERLVQQLKQMEEELTTLRIENEAYRKVALAWVREQALKDEALLEAQIEQALRDVAEGKCQEMGLFIQEFEAAVKG
jgi:regulator of replication initiation timing